MQTYNLKPEKVGSTLRNSKNQNIGNTNLRKQANIKSRPKTRSSNNNTHRGIESLEA